MRPVLTVLLVLVSPWTALAGNEELARQVKPALVAIYPAGREGTEAGVGSGFVISADGLVATNLHVIGEGRALRVEFADGNSREVTEVFAWDRDRDLAVIRVAGQGMAALELGDSAVVEQGMPAVVMGNPLGFRFSMVEGMVSARQEVEGRGMLQLALPVERGNSGGPVMDPEGKVIGIVTLKSAVTANLGFAVPVNDLKSLLEHPNPVAMRNWLTIGALNPAVWQAPDEGGTRWSQRAGTLQVRGTGAGFGGRSQCLAAAEPPELPYEISVKVKLEDESGAAGLSFCSDGGEGHYGFYPSNGGLRLTKFEGPDVSSWTILEQQSSPDYQSGGWNQLRVRVEADRIICYLNGKEVITSRDTGLRQGRAGLCQFRGTAADFRDFQLGPGPGAEAGVPDSVRLAVQSVAGGAEGALEAARGVFAAAPDSARALAEQEAAVLEQRAASLRRVALEAAESATAARLGSLFREGKEGPASLAEGALLLARLDNPDLDPAPWLATLDRMAEDVRKSMTEADRAAPEATLAALNRWLFEENGFHGSRDDFSHRSNSYLNEVIDDREGLPITLSVLHMELGAQLGLELAGIPLPGRFITQLRLPEHPDGGPYIDVFERGRLMNRGEAAALALENSGLAPREEDWIPATPRAILQRMLSNLSSRAMAEEDSVRLLRYVTAGIALDPEAVNPRLQRFYLLSRAGRKPEADTEADWLLEHRPPGTDEAELRRLLGRF